MYIHCRLICVVECFRNYNVQRELTNEHPYNFSTSTNLENSTCLQNQENNSPNLNNDNNRPNTKTTPGYANAYNPNLNHNFRQYQNEFPIFHNFSSSNYHYENIFINNRNDFMMRYNEMYFNIVRQLYEFLLVFKTQQNQNINDSNQNICANKEDYKTDANEEIKNANPSFDNSSKSVNTTFIAKKRGNDTDERTLQNKEITTVNRNKKQKRSNSNSERLKDQNMPHTSNIMGSQEIQAMNKDDSKNELCELNLKQSIVSIKESAKELKSLLPGLNLLKTYEQRFLNRNIQNEAFHSILSHNLKELTEVTECAKELCKKWIKKHGSIKDSVNNRILYEHFLRLNFDIRNNIIIISEL